VRTVVVGASSGLGRCLAVGLGKRGATVALLARRKEQLAEAARESIFDAVAAWCAAWAVGHAGPDECDRLGMTAALRLATRRAFQQLPATFLPDAVVLDGTFDYVSPPAVQTLFDPDAPAAAAGSGEPLEAGAAGEAALGTPGAPHVETVVKADARCASVAAASVLAKVTRDRIMRSSAAWYPPFEFERNKGYPSPAHQRALCGYGLSAVHRRSWAFVDNLPWELTSWPGDYRARNSRLDGGLLREPEHPLTDDVVEDLIGPPGDAHAR